MENRQELLNKFITYFQNSCLFDRENGMTFEILPSGVVYYRMTILERHLSSPQTSHGGVIAALMDATLGMAALSSVIHEGKFCSTVEMKLNFLTPAYLGDELEGTAQVDFKGKRLVVTSGEVRQRHKLGMVAKGMGTFNLYPMDKRINLHGTHNNSNNNNKENK